MEAILRTVSRNTGATVGVILLVAVGIAYASILGMSPEEQQTLLYTVQDFLPIFMFLTLATLLFSGFPVAFILGGIAFLFGMIGYFLDRKSVV
jgi:predicted membrane channel-forming protein YqfA (hemolysin III family)